MGTSKTRPRVVLLGASGQLGRALHHRLALFGSIVAPSSSEVDLERLERLGPWIRSAEPDLLVNAAAYTDVDRAEREPERAYRINGDAVAAIGAIAAADGFPVVHYSTDFVYDGSGDTPWSETDAPNPISTYGSSKLAGDRALLQSGATTVIFRTSWVYGFGSSNFVTRILERAREQPEIRIVDDQFGAPTSADLVACVTALVLHRGLGDLGRFLAERAGVVHLAAHGCTSRFGFAREIVERASAVGILDRRPTLVAVTSAESTAEAVRPSNSRLALDRLDERFGITPPHWLEDLARQFRGVRGAESRGQRGDGPGSASSATPATPESRDSRAGS